MDERMHCPHGIPLWVVKEEGCDECHNEAMDKQADEYKRINPDDKPEWPEEPDEPNPYNDIGGEG